MAEVRVHCPKCSARYRVEESKLGREVTCQKCQTRFVLALPAAAPDVTAGDGRPRGEDGIPRDWEPDDVILDLYEVIALPGTKHGYAEGGMGRVNLVRHREWQKDLAVKSVLPAKAMSARDIENFSTEAEQWVDTIGLHPNIVACHYVRQLGGVPRVFIEYVDGGSLNDWIASKRLYEGGPQAALERILDVAIQVAWGLHFVHELGLIHQDVKPLNVMMTLDGIAKVTDFGLAGAKALASGERSSGRAGQSLLATGAGMMTPAYCSPEQANIMAMKKAGTPRERWPKLTRRTDVWSWAASVLHMFLGKIVWPGGQVAYVGLQREPEEPHLPPMPGAVKDLLQACFQKRPEDRPHDLFQVATALWTNYQKETGRPYSREVPRPEEAIADTLNNRAISLIDLKKQEAAEKKWQESLVIDPHHPESTYNWGLIQWRTLRMTDQNLLRQLREVRASSADPARVDYLMGLVHLECGDGQAAVQFLSKAAEAGQGGTQIGSALALGQSLCAPDEQLPCSFESHSAVVVSVAFSPDGRYALSGSEDKTVRLWETASGRCLRSFEVHTGKVNSVAFSHDGRYALSGGEDKVLRLWETASGRCLRSFEGHWFYVSSVAFSPDGRHALSGGLDHTVRLWETASGRCLRSFEGHTGMVRSVAFSPDGRYALSGGEDKVLRLWETASGRCLRSFEGHTLYVESVAFSPDGRHVLSGGLDHTMRLWETASGRCLRSFGEGYHSVTSVAWSLDGHFALSGGTDRRLRLWRIIFAKQPVPLVISNATVSGSAVYRNLLQQVRDVISSDPAVAAGLLRQARQQTGWSRREDSLELARQLSRRLAHHSFAEGWEKRTFEGHTGEVSAVSWSPDGRLAFSGSEGTVRLWEVATGKCLHSHSFEGRGYYVESVAFSPDGCFALSGCSDGTLRLWEVASGKQLRSFEGHKGNVSSVAWSPEGRFALSGSKDKTLKLWEVTSGKCVRSFEGHTDQVNSVAFSPDGRLALSGGSDDKLRLWDVESGRCLRSFEGHRHRVKSVAWSPNGRLALSGSVDFTVRLWEVISGKCVRSFEGHTDQVNSVEWSPDGRFALSGSYDQTLRLWEVESGNCVRSFEGHTSLVNSIAFSPDGRFALSGGHDKTVRLWELDWELEPNQAVDWDEGARHFLTAFLTLQRPRRGSWFRPAKLTWTEDDFQRLLDRLSCAGYGWLRPGGVRRELDVMAAAWQGLSPLT